MRFVIHLHITDPLHYDLMLERSGSLATYRIDAGDINGFLAGLPVRAERIADHRMEYLGYEGPVGRGRGEVRIFDSGEYRDSDFSEMGVSVLLDGKRFSGELVICPERETLYSIRYIRGGRGDERTGIG